MAAACLYLATDGCDANDGTIASPLATLPRALELAGQLPLVFAPVTIVLADGDYVISETIVVGHRRLPGAPLTIAADNPGRVRLLGGRRIEHWLASLPERGAARLSAAARSHVVAADLRANGITDFGGLRARGFGHETRPSHLELFCDGRRLSLPRWPAAAFTAVTGTPPEYHTKDGHGTAISKAEGGFFVDPAQARQWAHRDEVFAFGYWCYDWAGSFEPVASFEPETGHVTIAGPYQAAVRYGIRDGARLYFLNMLEELNAPGQFYVDTAAGTLYLWPDAEITGSELIASVIESPLIRLDSAANVELRGLSLEAVRATAVEIRNGQDNRLVNCTVRNAGNHGIVIADGLNHEIVDCTVCHVGESGIEVRGGSRKALLPCGHQIRNCHIHHFGRWDTCYRPAVHMTGVGITVSRCTIHDAPHSGIIYWGNEHVIEYTEIYRTILETEDCGVIYTGRDFAACGNIIRYCFLHDNGYSKEMGHSLYFDDCVSGQSAVGNIFVEPLTRTVFIGGGRDILVENNVFIDCRTAVLIDGRGLDKGQVWHNMVYDTMAERLRVIDWQRPPYSVRYPQLAALAPFLAADDGVPPEGNIIRRNICVRGSWMKVHWHAEESMLSVVDNYVGDDCFVDAPNLNFSINEGSTATAIGFVPIEVSAIGCSFCPPARPAQNG